MPPRCRRIATPREFINAHQARLSSAADAIERHLRRLEEDSAAVVSAPSSPADAEDYRRRYEMSLDDIRSLKEAQAELQRQLSCAEADAARHVGEKPLPLGTLDWEAEKRRILAVLETDLDVNDPAQQAERLKIEDVLNTTEKALAEKDREIEELRRRLAAQGGSARIEAEQSAARDQAIDADAVVREERQRLAQLQEQWREKLRQTEVEMSLERAKLARRHAELEERARNLPAAAPAAANLPDQPEQPASGRWLARLGLTEADRERRRRL